MFKPIPQVDQLAVHFQLDGNLIHRDSDDAKRQLAKDTGGSSNDRGKRHTHAICSFVDHRFLENVDPKPIAVSVETVMRY